MGKIVKITPIGKPRQTQSDKWKKRPCVVKYRAFADELRYKCNLQKIEIDICLNSVFVIPMPKSWSNKKKSEMNGKPHQQKPDIDNIVKSILDSLLKEDSGVHQLNVSKIWGYGGSIEFNQ